MTERTISSLADIWPAQAELNARAGFDTAAMGRALDQAQQAGTLPAAGGARVEVGRALKCYLDALVSECGELQDCLAWKHWYREAHEGRQYELQDLQNARVEVTDMLFFWVSICQLLGMGPEDVFRLYEAKLAINHKRQDEKRSQAEHADHEDENREIV